MVRKGKLQASFWINRLCISWVIFPIKYFDGSQTFSWYLALFSNTQGGKKLMNRHRLGDSATYDHRLLVCLGHYCLHWWTEAHFPSFTWEMLGIESCTSCAWTWVFNVSSIVLTLSVHKQGMKSIDFFYTILSACGQRYISENEGSI